ncbi:MAG: hypothetical protein V1712_01655 [Patescibacteria group bacterium]
MNQKNLVKVIIGVLVLLIIAGVVWFIYHKQVTPPRVAMVSGWLFEIAVPNGVQKYLIQDDGEQITYLTEKEILKWVRSDIWIEPAFKWTPEQWATKCDEEKEQLQVVQSCSQSEFDNFRSSLNCQNDPTQKLCNESFENWRLDCEDNNQRSTTRTCILMPYEKYQTLMENYLHDHQINGSIMSAYVVSIPIVGVDQLL